ncbi:TrkH family potassium uptake protein [Treponema sp. OttesenSCG-928-L16]|nr:TrkH family potassium uptake protein [Treponema sp. OttesenSCG-928-L16]
MLLRTLSLLEGVAALFMIPSFIASLVLGEYDMAGAFAFTMGAVLCAALPAAVISRKRAFHFSAKDGFLLVFLAWTLTSLMGSMPYYLSGQGISFTDAFFESACGFATTGATTITDVEALPRSLLLWRSMSHWFGGMGIVLLTVALMPLLGVGGFQLIKAEIPGPEKEKITPKVTATAKLLWFFYCTLTVVLTLLFAAGGMDWFDAVCHAFTTMASGGISTKNKGIAHFDSSFIEGTCVVFMLLAGFNFNLYYKLLKGKWKEVLHNTEGRVYFGIFITAAAALTFILRPLYGSFAAALRCGSYQAASILSTTGSVTADYVQWPPLAQGVLLCLMFIGGCSGSTAGGIKVIRHAVLFKQAGNELKRVIYPRGIFSVQLNKRVGRKDVVYGAAGFLFLYLALTSVTALIVAASGMDFFSSFSSALSVVGNMGTGFGAVGPSQNYGAFPDHIKWLFSFVMTAGRLELWTVFILFTPEYWRR